MSDLNLRVNPKPTDPDRDAIHVACIKMVAGDNKLRAGEKFKVAAGTTNLALSAEYNAEDFAGVVNPFVTDNFRGIKKGEEFWGLLAPGLVSGMTHKWKCHIFDGPEKPNPEHELWIRRFCDQWNFNYDDLIENATAEDSEGRWDRFVVAHGIDLHSKVDLGEDHDLFWMHLEALTGKKFDDQHREKFVWSCSC